MGYYTGRSYGAY